MVTFRASGPVTVYRTESDGPRETGAGATKSLTRKQRMETTQSVEIEMPDGHVNLDAYAPRSHGLGVSEVVGVRAMVPDGWDDAELDHREWASELYGTPDEWIRAAVTWLSERTDETLTDALERFEGWEETSSRSLQNAIDGVTNNGRLRVESAYDHKRDGIPEWLDDDEIA